MLPPKSMLRTVRNKQSEATACAPATAGGCGAAVAQRSGSSRSQRAHDRAREQRPRARRDRMRDHADRPALAIAIEIGIAKAITLQGSSRRLLWVVANAPALPVSVPRWSRVQACAAQRTAILCRVAFAPLKNADKDPFACGVVRGAISDKADPSGSAFLLLGRARSRLYSGQRGWPPYTRARALPPEQLQEGRPLAVGLLPFGRARSRLCSGQRGWPPYTRARALFNRIDG